MDSGLKISWHKISEIASRDYTCGHCGKPLASNRGFIGELHTGVRGERLTGSAAIYVCHHCTCPTFFDADGEQTPGVCHGSAINGIDDVAVKDLYDEARRATSANCSTAAVLCCRKLLMHVAVAKGAEQHKTFKHYVEYLGEHYVPKPTIEWVNHIKDKGNEANHEITIAKPDEAKDLLAFVEVLLKLIYEFPATMRKKQSPSATQQ